jgi:hypothetical protein
LPRKKELHFFDKNYDLGIDHYKSEFDACSGESLVGEVTPQYFHNPVVAPLIKKHLPEIKMFVSLRNPVERAYSQYWRMVATSAVEPNVSFEDVLESNELVLNIGCYHDHLTRYYAYFSQEQLLVLIYDDLKADSEAFLTEILDFLGLDNVHSSELVRQKINAAASHQGLSRSKPMWYLYRILNRMKLYTIAGKLEKANRRSLPPMNKETRKFLVNYYAEQTALLEQLINRDLSAWHI